MTAGGGAPRVSVVMAVHDGERYVAEAVDSVLGQRFRDLELVVVDDGSTDRTAEIVRTRVDPRLRIVSNERNLGLSRSLNIGIAEARGEFIARLDADDVATPDRLMRQVEFMDANADVALVGSWYHEMAADGTHASPVRLPTRHWDLRWQLCFHCPFAHSAVLWRRRIVAEQVGGYDERLVYSLDLDLWLRIAGALRVANVPEYLVRIRSHAESMTATLGPATHEGLRMQGARVAVLLDWPAGDVEANAMRVQRLYRLIVSTPRDVTQPELLADAADALRLHDAFVARYDVPPDEARRQRAELRARLARQLLRASRTAKARGRRGATRELLRTVVALSPGALLSRQAVDASIGLAARALRRP